MFGKLFKEQFIAIDIHPHEVRALVVEKKYGKYKVVQWKTFELPLHAIVGGVIEDEETMLSVFRSIAKMTKTKRVRVALPDETILRTRITTSDFLFPWTSRSLIRERLLDEGIQRSDVFILEEIVTKGENEQHINFTSIPRVIFEKYHTLLKKADLVPYAYEPRGQAAARSLLLPGEDTSTILLELSGRETRVTSIIDSMTVGTTRIAIGPKVLLEEYDTYRDAEGIHTFFSFSQNNPYREALEKDVTLIHEMIDAAIISKHSKVRGKVSVRLFGEYALAPSIESYLATHLRVTVIHGNPWKWFSFDTSEIPPLSRSQALAFAPCIGLIIRAVA